MLPGAMSTSLGMEEKELDLLRMELDRKSGELASCRDDLAEAYAMLAKAGLDWAQERQEKAALEAALEELTSECEHLKAHREQLMSTLQKAQRQWESLRTSTASAPQEIDTEEGIGGHMGDCHVDNMEASLVGEAGELEGQELAGVAQQLEQMSLQCVSLSQQLEEARAELSREQERRQSLEDLAASVLKLLAEAKQEAEREREKGQNAENVAATLLKWAASEREAVVAERERLGQERKELDLSHRWREYNVRIKLQEAQLDVMEKVERLELLESTVRSKLETRGQMPLWTEAEDSLVRGVLQSLRQPLDAPYLDQFYKKSEGSEEEDAAEAGLEIQRASTVHEVQRPRMASARYARRLPRRASRAPSAFPAVQPMQLGAGPYSSAMASDSFCRELREENNHGSSRGGQLGVGTCQPGVATLQADITCQQQNSASAMGENDCRVTSTVNKIQGGSANPDLPEHTVEMLSQKLPGKLQLQVDEHIEPMTCDPLSCSSTRSDAPSSTSNFSSEFPYDTFSEDSFQWRPSPLSSRHGQGAAQGSAWDKQQQQVLPKSFHRLHSSRQQSLSMRKSLTPNKRLLQEVYPAGEGHPTLRVRPATDRGGQAM